MQKTKITQKVDFAKKKLSGYMYTKTCCIVPTDINEFKNERIMKKYAWQQSVYACRVINMVPQRLGYWDTSKSQ